MKFSVWLFRFAVIVLMCAGLFGCVPPSQSQMDDEKEPHFIEGKRAINSMDYTGAIDEFEKAVEANPRNASAHFELGWLYEEKASQPDPAAAIYHYQQFLKLRPTADTAEAVRQRIMNCKQDLAKAVLPLPSAPGVQRDLEQLIQSNRQLVAEVQQWRAYYQWQQTNRQPVQVSNPVQTVVQSQPTQPTQPVQSTQPIQTVQTQRQAYHSEPLVTTNYYSHLSPRTATRTYIVVRGETLASISRKFNVKLDSLVAANPGIDARHLRTGQTLNIP